ncbi:MAG: NAD(P)/FAD-dependent oxidoreductase [Myxococcota bacterium]
MVQIKMSGESDSNIDVAIIGGGVAGLYCAYRLLTDSSQAHLRPMRSHEVHVFEATDRIGGRLWTHFFDETPNMPADLGGQHIPIGHKNVLNLCRNHFGLDLIDVAPRPILHYHRGQQFRFDKPDSIPYALSSRELEIIKNNHNQPIYLIVDMIKKIVPEVERTWPFASDAAPDELVHVLRDARLEGMPLTEHGFANVMHKHLTSEADQMLRIEVSASCVIGNWNCYDAILGFLRNYGYTKHFRLSRGYGSLPQTLYDRVVQNDGQVHLSRRLLAANGQPDGRVRLYFRDPDQKESVVVANHVVLAMPPRAFELIDDDSVIFESPQFRKDLRSVRGIAASKIFLVYPKPWWESVDRGPGKLSTNARHLMMTLTDMPMRLCYYMGSETDTGSSLLMASYADELSVLFWSPYVPAPARSTRLRGFGAKPSHDMRRLSDEINRQLRIVHGVPIPDPINAIYCDWSSDPFGAGVHQWNPHVASWEAIQRIRKPLDNFNILICGEAFSDHQGWVEGAINTAERVLQDHFGLPRADWIPADYDLGP